MKKIQGCILWIGSALCLPAFAFSLKGLDVAAAAGPAWYHATNSHIEMQIDATETDTVHVTSLASTLSYQAGVGYHFHPHLFKTSSFLRDILLQLNLSHDSATLNGNVLVFDMTSGMNYSFRAPISSTRLTLDLKPQLFKLYKFAPYLIAGGGLGWNRISFYEIASSAQYNPGCVSLSPANSTHFIWDVGLGVRRPITKHFYVSAEYLTTFLGNLSPDIQAISKQTVLTAPTFKVWLHSFMFSAGWEF